MKQSRFIVASLFCVVALLVLQPTANAQPPKPDAEGGDSRVLTTPDGWPIHINYYEGEGMESPVIILFPGVEGKNDSMTRKVWSGVAKALNAKGFAVVTADLRKHGDSVQQTEGEGNERESRMTSRDFQAMAALDLETIKAFLLQEHENQKLNIRKLGIATAGSGALVASAFAVSDWAKLPWNDNAIPSLKTPRGQDVRAILMLSPKANVSGLSSASIMRSLSSLLVAIHIWYNPALSKEKTDAKKIHGYVRIKDRTLEALAEARKLNEGPSEKQFSGEGLLQGRAAPLMEQHITEFFDTHLDKLEFPWKTRKSPLQ